MPSLTGEGLVIWILGLLLPLVVEGFKKLSIKISGRTAFTIAFVSSFVLAILAIVVTNGFKFTSLADAVSSISLVSGPFRGQRPPVTGSVWPVM